LELVNPVSAFRDFLDAAGMIQEFTGGLDFEAFRQDQIQQNSRLAN
jgi:uncharacterized protein with HEPN domain